MLNRPDPFDPGQLFAGFEHFSGLLIAVSGGPDSLALMRLARSWRDAGAKPALHAATVDHGLRLDSAAEADQVGRWARALGLPHEILVWRGEKPQTGVQEKAREARYALLFEQARAVGADAVATAHHADDQWETILIRLARGSGIAGLSGMARDQGFTDGRLVRPLLGLRKAELIDYCRREGQDFFIDPANSNPVFARARWRALAPALRDLGLTPERLEKFGARARKADEALDSAARDLMARAKKPESDDYDLRLAQSIPVAVFERFLALAIEERAGAAPARLERLELFTQKLQLAYNNRAPFHGTLGGCAASLSAEGFLSLRREPRRRRGAAGQRRDFPDLSSD
ncbi:tRNA lysidine(34) synthetase TilS [Rhodoblastus sp.]|uniref:tRNA lysidine(34) synthetase TilS n=1 Tax=Rhodoblastus sp. TaxID=1962975 RepID=UPI00262D09E9|nr:tRNA lysidine(34) synthetase TilS [Rhodoblastus sp.]